VGVLWPTAFSVKQGFGVCGNYFKKMSQTPKSSHSRGQISPVPG